MSIGWSSFAKVQYTQLESPIHKTTSRKRMIDKCPKCRVQMEIVQDAYAHKSGVIVLHEVERCPECGETILTEEQMDAFVKKLKQLNLWKDEYGIVRRRKDIPEFQKLVEISERLWQKGIKLEVVGI